ncbi:TlpA family protein disulfide reductase [Streptococcus sp. E29BA]|uniref:TlpA family protein disulfide reductase n=1 Tax=Streptococcus sp. E29BA TaxID=3278716 RepID=UPI00359E950C
MFKSFKFAIMMAVALFTLCGCSLLLPSQEPIGISKGQVAPDVTLVDKDGKSVSLKDYAGKKIYINVWASWCGPCKQEIPELEKVYQNFKDKDDYVFLSVVSPNDNKFNNQRPMDSSEQEILSVAKDSKITYPVLFDTKDSFASQFGITSFPTHIIINSDGTVGQVMLGSTNEDILTKLLQEAN